MDRPKLRSLEPLPTDADRFYLRDPLRVSDSVLLVPKPVLYLLSLMDGERTREDLRAEFLSATGQILPGDQLDQMIHTLDEALFLDNERFAEVQARVVRAFHESDVRPAMHAGMSYPKESKELAALLEGLLRDGAVGSADGEGGELEAAVAPHIDLGRGGVCYGSIYRRLARDTKARRFIVLGISHHPLQHAFALTTKDYDTPLGCVRTDRDLVRKLAGSCRTDFLTDEIAHRDEHSVEFQMLFLQHLLGGTSELSARREFTVVPILCASLQPYVQSGKEPYSGSEGRELLDALGGILDGRAEDCVIAAVDFAHLGRQFGQEMEVRDEVIREAEAADRRMMQTIVGRDAPGFFRHIAQEKDARNVCGVPAIYGMLRLIGGGRPGRIERYGQAVDRKAHSIVTFAGIGFPRG